MFPIVKKEDLSPGISLFEIASPDVARARHPGQFVILRVDEFGERVPLTVADADASRGTITIICQGIGKTTKKLNSLKTGDSILDVVGPLGNPTHIEKFGTVVCIGGGVGVAEAYPLARALKEAGNHVISIMGFRSKGLLFLEKELRSASDELFVTTDDGTYGEKGLVTDRLGKLLANGRGVNFVLAIGPTPMMRAVCEATRPSGITTMVSLNPIMLDGTGMCGACRVTVGGKTKFACVDGPEFDGHQVDFTELAKRQAAYRDKEKESLEAWIHEEGACHAVRRRA